MNYEAAIPDLKQAVELDSNYYEAQGYLGMAYARVGDQQAAIKHLSKAIDFAPKSTLPGPLVPNAINRQQLCLILAEIYRVRNEFAEAIRYLKIAAEIPPGQEVAYRALAAIYEQQNQSTDAAYYYERAANLVNPGDAFNWNFLMGRAARLRGRYPDSLSFFRNLASVDPALGAYEMGLTHISAKNKGEALAQHQELVRLKSFWAEDLLKRINEMK